MARASSGFFLSLPPSDSEATAKLQTLLAEHLRVVCWLLTVGDLQARMVCFPAPYLLPPFKACGEGSVLRVHAFVDRNDAELRNTLRLDVMSPTTGALALLPFRGESSSERKAAGLSSSEPLFHRLTL
jgi:hypothetical protein